MDLDNRAETIAGNMDRLLAATLEKRPALETVIRPFAAVFTTKAIFVENLSRELNLDVLEFSGGDDEEEGSAQAGKYVSDKVFLGVKAGASVGSGTATVEIEVTPRIKVEGTVGSSDKSEIGIKWKRDY